MNLTETIADIRAKRRRTPTIPAPPGHYGCTACGQIKPLSEFYKRSDGSGKPFAWCRSCKKTKGIAARRPSPTLVTRFWSKVETDGVGAGCWEWTGARRAGYGLIWSGEALVTAHRVSLDLHGIYVPTGMVADHMCRNPCCVNPAHLRVVTERQNAIENNDNPFVRNVLKTHCINGHEFTPENTAVKRCVGPKGTPMLARHCLTCYPRMWPYAIIERPPLPGSKVRAWRGPDTLDKE